MNGNLREDERISIALRALYQTYGYRPYRVNRFEEYELYLRNKKFLGSERILSFSDTDGKLMALRPDITLSIVKNAREEELPLRVCYAETAYRVPHGAHGFREIMQVGVECIGQVDLYAMGEVLMLAARSLETISPNYVLDVSDMGLIAGVLGKREGHEAILAAISQKNLHGLREACAAQDIDARTQALLEALTEAGGPLEPALAQLDRLDLPEACRAPLARLRALAKVMRQTGGERIRLDLSVVNDMNYYNGLIFSGFIEGVPTSVLTGGRYDPLLTRMGHSGEAIGFAVDLSALEQSLPPQKRPDVDVLLIYGKDADAAQVARAAEAIIAGGESVRVQREGRVTCTYKRRVALGEGEVGV